MIIFVHLNQIPLMAIIDIKLPQSIARALNIPVSDARSQQLKVLNKLLRKARFTEFGQRYRFDDILLSRHPGKNFQELVPTYDYNKIYDAWWHKAKEGIPDVCWPGVIKYFALSSGTSDAPQRGARRRSRQCRWRGCARAHHQALWMLAPRDDQRRGACASIAVRPST